MPLGRIILNYFKDLVLRWGQSQSGYLMRSWEAVRETVFVKEARAFFGVDAQGKRGVLEAS